MTGSGRFGREARLTRKADFDRVFADARGAGSRYFRVLGRSNTLGQARIGLVVSRKVDPRAVGRNRIKRIVRDCFRLCRGNLRAWDLVVLAKPDARRASNAELKAAFERCLERFASPTGAHRDAGSS